MRFFLFALLLIGTGVAPAQEDLFKRGLASFESGDYADAISQFEGVLNDGVHSPDLYFNLGLAHHRSGHLGEAILSLERALKLNPKHRESLRALPELKAEIADPVTSIEAFILWKWYRMLIEVFSSDQWAILQLIFGIGILSGCFYLFFLSLSYRVPVTGLLLICLVGFGWSWYASAQKRSLEIGGEGGIVMLPQTTIFNAPDDRSEVVTEVGEGTKVYILDQIGQWLKVQLEDRDTGWIEQKKVEII